MDRPAMAAPSVERVERADGTTLLRSRTALEPYEVSVGVWLRRWADERPTAVVFAERPRGDAALPWDALTYAAARRWSTNVAAALLRAGLGPERPLAVLSGNGLGHAVLALAAQDVGAPVVPVSPAYSLLSSDHGKLRHVLELVRPGLLYVEDPAPFAAALASAAGCCPGVAHWSRAELDAHRHAAVDPGDAAMVDAAHASVGADSVAKILFTSGSTGIPKGVLTTHRMLCANQQAIAQVWPFTADTPPVLCDWLPWSHTFGGSHNVNMVLKRGGTFYIDTGRPAPGLLETTVANLADTSPTIAFNVPAGYGALVERLERDPAVAAAFFRRLQVIFYAAAALPQDTWQRLEAVSERTVGYRVVMTSAWGATETAPAVASAHFPLDRAGVVGVPVPGAELKLVPNGAKLEVRVRGDHVTPGYHRQPELTEAAFDEEGFYRIGDALRPADPTDPDAGLLFDGRVAEDFKLTTGTWVSVGTLRPVVLSATAPLLADAVVTGHDRDHIGLLAWLTPAAAARPRTDVAQELRDRLGRHNAGAGGSSQRIERVLLLEEPASIDRGEITDKGYINQRAVLDHRATAVAALYAATEADPGAVVLVGGA